MQYQQQNPSIPIENVKDAMDFQNAKKLAETLEHGQLSILEKGTDENPIVINIPLTRSYQIIFFPVW